MNWTILSLIDDLKDFASSDWGELIWTKILFSLKGALKGR